MTRGRRIAAAALLAVCVAGAVTPAWAYPEFKAWIDKSSGRHVDCGFCHANPEGPEGVRPGQIRSLDAEQLERLNVARAAFEPGQKVANPILNAFGNEIIERLGKRRFLQIRSQDPGLLPGALEAAGDGDSDLDGDGIPDVVELREGTDPLNPRDGAPLRLLVANLASHWFDILMIALATLCGLYGLNHLFAWANRRGRDEAAEEHPTGGGTLP